jgi:hypothetical protein
MLELNSRGYIVLNRCEMEVANEGMREDNDNK